jgi:hypothetical protein
MVAYFMSAAHRDLSHTPPVAESSLTMQEWGDYNVAMVFETMRGMADPYLVP